MSGEPRLFWVPQIADPAAPTAAELAGAIPLDCEIVDDGLQLARDRALTGKVLTQKEAREANPMLHLDSQCLLSKWGFNDGDTPDSLLDYCDAHGIPYPDDWHGILHRMVRERLLPILDQRVEITFIDTCHNPVRAVTVDGVDGVDQWCGDAWAELTPEGVEIPMAEVIEMRPWTN